MEKAREKALEFNSVRRREIKIISVIREVVFGLEDGMISTLGVLVGIAIGTSDHFVIILSGLVVIVVESLSMGVGSYLSAKSVREIAELKIKEEEAEIKKYPEEEKQELVDILIRDGWPKDFSSEMATVASKSKPLLFREMAYRELYLHPEKLERPLLGGVFMFFSYVIGGTIPLLPYFIFSIPSAVFFSVGVTFIGLFALGCATTKFTKRHWFKAGMEMFSIAGLAALVGYLVGMIANHFILK